MSFYIQTSSFQDFFLFPECPPWSVKYQAGLYRNCVLDCRVAIFETMVHMVIPQIYFYLTLNWRGGMAYQVYLYCDPWAAACNRLYEWESSTNHQYICLSAERSGRSYCLHCQCLKCGFCAVQLGVEFLGWVWVRNTVDLHISGIAFGVNIIGNICYSTLRYWWYSTWNGVFLTLNSTEKLYLQLKENK